MSLFATKSVSRIMSESEGGEHQLKRTLGATQLIALGIGAIIGAGLFSLTGVAAAQNAGPAVVVLHGHRRDRLRLRRAVLQRILLHDPGGRQRLHLRVRHAGRVDRLDHRLGPGARVRGRLGHRVDQLVGLRGFAAARVRHQSARPMDRRSVRDGGAAGRHDGAGLCEHAGRDHRLSDLLAADDRHQGIGARQRGDRGDQAGGGAGVHRGGLVLHQSGQLQAIPSAEYRRVRLLRHQRHHDGRGHHLLRVYRLRRGLDGGAGVQEPAEGHAHRHHRLAGGVHRAVPPFRRGAHRAGALHATRRGGAGCAGHRQDAVSCG